MAGSPSSASPHHIRIPCHESRSCDSGDQINNKTQDNNIFFQGRKPILKEIGPFSYKAVTVKDSVDYGTDNSNLQIDESEGTLTYRPRYRV